ncbi:hypothetical protein SAMN05192583_3536 [Sphingomonas gellani]|uniref:Uncharacterized protein n=1 Tax=Sphingomonas gellani TaxID=1166340 RepID=A0A1H8J910_9SPHN|nr:hypothetical protein [Sphingomonas gellani]SEN77252.1 hypothetical protein SAMN05192583_3536 [Sphingomonas gellani]
MLLQLRTAQKKERDALAERRRTLLDQHLFQRGDTREPTPEYAAFLLAIRDDPTLLRWQLDKGGKRRAPVIAGGDQAFRDRFSVYMQHPAVQRQVTNLFERTYDPGTAWPDELAHGMWRYEPGRYGHRSAAEARDGWAAGDTRFREALAPAGAPPPILDRMKDLIVPDLRQVLRLSDADLVRLLHPGVQHDLIVRWREQQEERVECLAAVADGTARVNRRLVSIDGGAVRPKVMLDAVPPTLAAAFARWQDDPDFYIDVALDSAATRAAARRKARCADPHLRALRASREAGDTPAVQRVLAACVAMQDATAAGRAHRGSGPEIPYPARPFTPVRSGKTKRPPSRLHSDWITRLPPCMREVAISPYRTGTIALATPDCSRLLALFGPRDPASKPTSSSKSRRRRYRIRKFALPE